MKEVKDILKYVQDNDLDKKFFKASKTRHIIARLGDHNGETIHSLEGEMAVDDTKMVCYYADDPDKNVWAPKLSKFKEQYEMIHQFENGTAEYEPSPDDATREFVQINEDIHFYPPEWGGADATLSSGGYLVKYPNNHNDVYCIAEKEFLKTYK